MKRFFTLTFVLMSLFVMFACANREKTTEENTAPEILGVKTEVQIEVGQTWDALKDVTATDAEDGDLTNSIVITSMPELTVTDGIITPTNTGTYYITYSVTDKAGETTEEYTTLIVNEVLGEPVEFINYEFVATETDMNGFEVTFNSPAEGTYEAEKGVVTINVTSNGEVDNQAQFYKNGINIEEGANYTFTIRMKASEKIYAHYIINNAEEGWKPFSGKWNLEIGTEFNEYSLQFLAETSSENTEFILQFGGDTYDIHTNPEAFLLIIDSIRITKSTGEFVENEVLKDDFEEGLTEGWKERGVDSHSATISNVNNQLQFNVETYPVDNNPWEMDLYRVTDYDLVSGSTYKLVFDYTTVNDQFYELCFEDPSMDWQVRAGFKDGTLKGSGTFEFIFVASMDITNLHIKLSLGKGSASTNVLTIDNFVFYELTGDKIEETETTEFVPDEVAWGTYNNNNEGAFGVVYVENGNLIYEIESFGKTDWYNKLYFEDILLTGNGLYTMVFTAKADKTIEGVAGLNVMGKWDPRIWKPITITEEEQTFSFTMDAKLLFDLNFEMLFQFGFESNEGPAKITFTEIKILRQE
ncbi:MAG: DUF5011 domain-containing protein [Bacilli bacterium]|nr:DUF5011 domain-containing protein [Bacilli bacterium]